MDAEGFEGEHVGAELSRGGRFRLLWSRWWFEDEEKGEVEEGREEREQL